ncbi:Mor transcription activator-like protein [Methylophaga frappieri]|uniref:Mor transcription activator-like protein n=2 Tax=Methylophaga frappieri (strain ATCC BAA-2434 / DSM 25690 / JAM7) TaxID=754477 RepID=I1YGC9_METFJ|nr:Mor transcription activator-like protein [Methylophaga frappieri]
METRRHELLEDIHAQVSSVAGEHGIEADLADQIGCAIADHLANNWGGQNFTFPKDHHYQISSRDEEIYDKFNGRNHHILAKDYNLTIRAIYKIIKRVRAKGDPNQTTLF